MEEKRYGLAEDIASNGIDSISLVIAPYL